MVSGRELFTNFHGSAFTKKLKESMKENPELNPDEAQENFYIWIISIALSMGKREYKKTFT